MSANRTDNNGDRFDPVLPIMEHLRQLTMVIKRCALASLAGFTAAWIFREKITWFFQAPLVENIKPEQAKLVVQKATDVFMLHMNLSFYFGLLFVAPYVLYEIWSFIVPGLYKNERKFALGAFTAGILFFALGAGFAYFLVLPRALEFLIDYAVTTEKHVDLYLNFFEMINFIILVMIGFGVVFELPLLIVLSCMTGIVSPDFFAQKRGVAIIIIATIAAIFTPPDVFSMLALLVPMVVLYEAAIIFSRLIMRSKKKAAIPK